MPDKIIATKKEKEVRFDLAEQILLTYAYLLTYEK